MRECICKGRPMTSKRKLRREDSHMWSGFWFAATIGVAAFIISEMTYSSVEGTWTSDTPRLSAHMVSYLAAWATITVVFWLLQNLATGSKSTALHFAAPWLLNGLITGAAVVLHISAYVVVPVTTCVALWALYRMKVKNGPPLKISLAMLSTVSGVNIVRIMKGYSASRRQQSGTARKQSKPNIKS